MSYARWDYSTTNQEPIIGKTHRPYLNKTCLLVCTAAGLCEVRFGLFPASSFSLFLKSLFFLMIIHKSKSAVKPFRFLREPSHQLVLNAIFLALDVDNQSQEINSNSRSTYQGNTWFHWLRRQRHHSSYNQSRTNCKTANRASSCNSKRGVPSHCSEKQSIPQTHYS